LMCEEWTYDDIYTTIKYFDTNGLLDMENIINNDTKEELYKEWYENGQLKSEKKYLNGYLNGELELSKSWYENGNLRFEEKYKDGKLNGLQKIYFKNGKLQFESNWKDGELNGWSKTYFEYGGLKNEIYY